MMTTTEPMLRRPQLEFPKFTWKSKTSVEFESLSSRRRRVTTVKAKGGQDNRKQLQKGRYLSSEAIQSIQSLKRAYIYNSNNNDTRLLHRTLNTNFSRLLKFDMLAVLRELIRQNHCLLALQVFEEIRKEYWYKPQLSLYNDLIKVLASNGYMDQVALVCSYLKAESNLQAETESFNALFTTFLTSNLSGLVMDFYDLMKAVNCEPDRSTFKILINGLESRGEYTVSAVLRQDACKYYGESLDFLEEQEEVMGEQAKA
ncbi:protein THYLAKOID ASSEMBLY 8-like, chloroplastic [Euphorbia lathyris]|uniref:protein THYLAKOID ASSEMBLY 8-like, chloroplastic n=1 Tax=Euphorbia lathyris TaxID=212925 RepID=UPI003313C973